MKKIIENEGFEAGRNVKQTLEGEIKNIKTDEKRYIQFLMKTDYGTFPMVSFDRKIINLLEEYDFVEIKDYSLKRNKRVAKDGNTIYETQIIVNKVVDYGRLGVVEETPQSEKVDIDKLIEESQEKVDWEGDLE